MSHFSLILKQLDPEVVSSGKSAIRSGFDDNQPRQLAVVRDDTMLPPPSPDVRNRGIGGSVVDDDNMRRSRIRAEQGFEAGNRIVRVVPVQNDYAEGRSADRRHLRRDIA